MKITILTMLGIFALIVGLIIVGPFITAWAWNTLFAESVTMSLFGVAKMGWWKAFALGWLSLLIKPIVYKSNSK